MFMHGRRRTHGQLVKAELGESFDHFVRAAAHAANGVGESVGPRVETARGFLAPAATRFRRRTFSGWGSTMTALVPLAAAATDNTRQAGSLSRKAGSKKMRTMGKKQSLLARRRWSILTGLLAAGAVAGAAGAIMMRRRQQPDWDSYDPGHALDSVREDAKAIIGKSNPDGSGKDGSKPAPASEKSKAAGSHKTGTAATEKAKDRPAAAGERVASATSAITESAKQTATKGTDKADGLLGSNVAAPSSRNSHG